MVYISSTQDYNSVAEIINELNQQPAYYRDNTIEHRSCIGTKHFFWNGNTFEQGDINSDNWIAKFGERRFA